MKIKDIWAKLFGKKPVISDQEMVRGQIVKEIEMAASLARFLLCAVNRGHGAKITIEVDGVRCEIGILAKANEPLMEYLANWACLEKIKKHSRLEEFDKGVAEYQRERFAVSRRSENCRWRTNWGGIRASVPKTGAWIREIRGPQIAPEGP